MDIPALRGWLAEPRAALAAAVADGVRAHVAALRSAGAEFYGYALLPGEKYEIGNLVAATNSEADISAPPDDEMHAYYRYSVDEWQHYHQGCFEEANRLIAELHRQFDSLHSKPAGECRMDEFELAHADALYAAVIQGLDDARQTNAFAGTEPILVVWIPDSDASVIIESAKRLNSEAVANQFVAQFG